METLQRPGHHLPVGCLAALIVARERDLPQSGDKLIAQLQVLCTRGTLGIEMCRNGLVRGLERSVEALPKGSAGGAPQAVELLPARAQVVDDFGPLPDRQLDDVHTRLTAGGGRPGLG